MEFAYVMVVIRI